MNCDEKHRKYPNSRPDPLLLLKTGTQLNFPVYLDQKVQTTLAALASAKGVDFSTLINDLLKKDIELIEMAR